MPGFLKDKAVWIPLVGVILALVVISFFRSPDDDGDLQLISLTDAIIAAQRGDVAEIEIHSRYIRIDRRSGEPLRANIGRQTDVVAALQGEGVSIGQGSESVPVRFAKTSDGSGFWIMNLGLPIVALFVLYWAVRIGVRHGFEAYERRRAETRD